MTKIYLTSSLLEVTVSKVAHEILLLGVGLLSGERKSIDKKKNPFPIFTAGSDQMKKAQKKFTLSKIDFLSSVIIIGLD